MTVVEFATWPVADNWKDILEPALLEARHTNGCSDLFIGTPEEDSNTVHLTVVWESLEHHQALMNAPNYPQVVAPIQASLPPNTDLSALGLHHVDFSTHARSEGEAVVFPALLANVTEKVVITLKESTTKEELAELLNGVRDKITEDSKVTEGISTPVLWGQTVEDPKVFIMLIGWDSSKLHHDVVGHEKYASVLGPLRAKTDLKIFHISSKRYNL